MGTPRAMAPAPTRATRRTMLCVVDGQTQGRS
jgi:hypothetical protein